MANNIVLIVENTDAGYRYKQLLENELGVEVIWVKTEKEAIETVESNFIKVAVLDQRLTPPELGTEVFKKLKKIQPNIMGIMFSGRAQAKELNEAKEKLQYYKFVDKNDVLDELPESVREALEIYNFPSPHPKTNYQRKLIYEFRKSKFSFLHKFEVYLISSNLLEEHFVFDDRWAERMSVAAGDNVTREFEIEFKKTAELEVKSLTELETKFTSKVKVLQNTIGNEIAGKLSTELKTKESNEIRIKAKITNQLSVPAIPSDVKQDYLASKSFETNQVYEKHIFIIEVLCNYCLVPETIPIVLFVPTNKIWKRQIDVLRSGQKTIIDIGIAIVK